MMYEYEKPKCKFLNRLSTLLQLHPTPAAHLFSRLCGLHTVSAPQFPVSPSGLTKPRPQDSSAPRTAPPPGRLRPQDGSAPCALTCQTPCPSATWAAFLCKPQSGQSFPGLNPVLTPEWAKIPELYNA